MRVTFTPYYLGLEPQPSASPGPPVSPPLVPWNRVDHRVGVIAFAGDRRPVPSVTPPAQTS